MSTLACVVFTGVSGCEPSLHEQLCDNPPAIVFWPTVVFVDGEGRASCLPSGTVVRAALRGREAILPLTAGVAELGPDGTITWTSTGPGGCNVFADPATPFDPCSDLPLVVSVTAPGCAPVDTAVHWEGGALTLEFNCGAP